MIDIPPCPPPPVLHPARNLWYPDVNATDPFGDMEGRIRAVMAANPPPFFMVVYGQVRSLCAIATSCGLFAPPPPVSLSSLLPAYAPRRTHSRMSL